MARPQKVSKTKLAMCIVRGVFKSEASRMAGVSRQTFDNMLKKYPELAELLIETRETTTDIVESALIREGRKGRPWAIQFYLSNMGRDRGYGPQLSISTAPNVRGIVAIVPGNTNINQDSGKNAVTTF